MGHFLLQGIVALCLTWVDLQPGRKMWGASHNSSLTRFLRRAPRNQYKHSLDFWADVMCKIVHLGFIFKQSRQLKGWQDGPAGKSACHKDMVTEFDPQFPCRGGRVALWLPSRSCGLCFHIYYTLKMRSLVALSQFDVLDVIHWKTL